MRNLLDAAQRGTRVDLLTALRDRIASEIEAGVAAKDLAALSRQLRDITKELDELSGPKEGSAADDLATRRASRRSGAPAPRRAAR